MKKILISLLAIALVVGLVGAGSFAYFSDTETSSGNTFTAGTLDLAVNTENPWTGAEITLSDMKPSVDSAEQTLNFKNVGTLAGELSFTLTITGEADGVTGAPDGTGTDMSADDFARLVYISSANFSTTDNASGWDVLSDWVSYADANGDGKVSVYEMAQKTWLMDYDHDTTNGIDTPLPGGKTATAKFKLHLGDQLDADGPDDFSGNTDDYAIVLGVLDNDAQGDGCAVTIQAVLEQP